MKCSISFKNKQYTYELEKHNTVNDLFNLFLKDIPEMKKPMLARLMTNKLPFSRKDLNKPLSSFEKDAFSNLFFEISESLNCKTSFNCKICNYPVSKYCLGCSKFICNSCVNDHLYHNLIDIDPKNLNDSLKLFQTQLIANLSEEITLFNKQFNILIDDTLSQKIINWKINILKKIETFVNFIQNLVEKKQILKSKFQSMNKKYNKIMVNMTKNEMALNNNTKNFTSLEETEVEILKLKDYFTIIEGLKLKEKSIINANNINNFEKYLNEIPFEFDNLSKSTLLILEDIKSFEKTSGIDSNIRLNKSKLTDSINEKNKFENKFFINIKDKKKYDAFLAMNKSNDNKRYSNNKLLEQEKKMLVSITKPEEISEFLHQDNNININIDESNCNDSIAKNISSINNKRIIYSYNSKISGRNCGLRNSLSIKNSNNVVSLPKIFHDKKKEKTSNASKEIKVNNKLSNSVDNKNKMKLKTNFY